jgi:hypothetical protein
MDFREQLKRYADRGCRGLGEFLPDLPFDDARCLNLYRQAGECRMPVLFDLHDVPGEYGLLDGPGLPRLEHSLRACPATVFIGHGPTFWAEISGGVSVPERQGYPFPSGQIRPNGAMPRLMASYDNLWADISAGSGFHALTRDPAFGIDFLRKFQDKILFGTDACQRFETAPVCANRELMRRIRNEHLLSEEACRKIESANAQRLLRI